MLMRSPVLRTVRPAGRLALQYSTNAPPNGNQNEKDSVSSGVGDKGTSTHGFDPLKPRKPLSRVAIGGTQGSRVSKGDDAPSFRSNWMAAIGFVLAGGGLLWWFKRERRRLEVRRLEKEHAGVGKPQIGGPFNLIDDDGKPFTDKNLLGKFSILYFGFTKCPDVCPEELEVLAYVLNETNKKEKKIQPIFVTCDPARDTPEVLKEYLADFHEDIIGLTGPHEEIKNICKQYRVYFSTPPNLKPGQQYLVDHSIFFYIMDPEGNFIDVMGRNYTGPEALAKVQEHLDAWRPSGEDSRSWIQKIVS